jgi:hypothetical protein
MKRIANIGIRNDFENAGRINPESGLIIPE